MAKTKDDATEEAGQEAAQEAGEAQAASPTGEQASGAPAEDQPQPEGAETTEADAASADEAAVAGDDAAEETPADSDADEEAPTEDDVIAELQAENAELRDKWVRALAEAENVRRRAERDRKDAAAYGGTRLARDLLSVHDNLERALKAADDDIRAQAGAFVEGIDLTLRELIKAFSKHKIEKIAPEAGEKFDPNLHEAMFEAPIPHAEPGSIIEVMEEGFTIADRLLRPARVGIARAMPEAPKEEDAAE